MSSSSNSSGETVNLAEEPTLRFRQLHQELHAFATLTIDDDDAQRFTTALMACDFLTPLAMPPQQSAERNALQNNKVKVAGKSIDVSPVILQEILKLSDEFHVSETMCFEFWYLASDEQRREWIERVDQLPVGSITTSIPAAARHFLISETEYKLILLKELMRLRFDDHMDEKRRKFIVTYTNKLLSDQLLSKLVATYDDHLPKLLQIAHIEQSASYWHCLMADCIVFIVSSCRILPQELQRLATLMQTLCGRLDSVVAKVSPHIVNLSSFAQLFEGGSLAGTSPAGAVKQVSCMLQAITTVQVALFAALLQKNAKVNRETGDVVVGPVLSGSEHAGVVKELHRIFYEQEWEQKSFQSVAMLAWAGFLGSNGTSTGRSVRNVLFAEAEATPRVVKKAVEERAFTTMAEVQLKYFPDRMHDPLLYSIYERNFELLFTTYSSSLMVDVPTVADQAALAAMQSESGGEVAAWTGDCLENIIEFAAALCKRDTTFACSFWRHEDLHQRHHTDEGSIDGDADTSIEQGSCHEFLIACRDAAFKNPACFAAYMRLVAAAASGPDCAQFAFHHVKQNPSLLNWEHFFGVMAKYQRLLTEAEKPQTFPALLPGVTGAAVMDGSFDTRRTTPGPRFIRPKELEALESIQLVIQAVIRDHQLALIFFHNHDWSPIATFVSFLQCRIPSSLKGALMKTLAIFAKVPEISPFVWRQVDALQILRTTGDTSGYGNQDISYELEHYESMSRTYPATRGFVILLYELFENPHAWNSFEGDGRVAAIQVYFEFLLERVFLKFDLRKYEHEEEKWALVNGALAIFKKILRKSGNSATEGSLAYQILARLLSGSTLLDKLLLVLSCEGGVESLESTSTDVHLEYAFFYCLDIVKRKTEATHGSLNFVIDISKKSSSSYLTKTTAVAALRERCVQHALEIVVLVLENDATFVNIDLNRQLSHRLQVEMLHTILCRYRSDFVTIVHYIKYTKSAHIPHLSAVILRLISNRMSGTDLVDLLIDSGSSADIIMGYMNRLLNANEDFNGNGALDSDIGEDEESELDGDSVITQSARKRKRHDTSILPSIHSLSQDSSNHSIRAAILDLFLENLAKPSPNLAHLLLGILDKRKETAPGTFMKTGLDAVITLVSNAEFGLESPELAERCHRVIHCLITQDFSSNTVLAALESPHYDYFATQIQLFSTVIRVKRRLTTTDAIAELNMRGWFYKSLAVYVHVCLHKEPPQMKKVNRLMRWLLSSTDHAGAKQNQMLLLQFLDENSFDISPPEVPHNQNVVELAEKVTSTVDQGVYKWLRIDIERFCREIQSLDLSSMSPSAYFSAISSKRFRSSENGTSTSAPFSGAEEFIQWAVQWNIYSERVAAESHALNSLREVMEVIVLDYLSLHTEQDASETPTMWQGLDNVTSSEVRLELMNGIVLSVLSKLTDKGNASGQLFEIVARIALLLFSQLSPSSDPNATVHESHYRQNIALLELLFRAICRSTSATGNPLAARNARTLLYSCVINILHLLPPRDTKSSSSIHFLGFGASAGLGQRAQLLSNQVIDLICRDASDGDDTLSMALAISALETIVSFEGSPVIIKIFRERGYLLHFISIFRKLCEMDAFVDRGDAVLSEPSQSRGPLLHGVDAATVGTMYECFLSLFTKIASSKEGAVALLEGGLVRVISEAGHLPTHRPKYFVQGDTTSASITSVAAFQRVEAVYYRKWLPVVRFLSTLGASLPQNETLASQLLQLVTKHRKICATALKIDRQTQPGLNLLREVSYVTFIFRYVAQFTDLCEKTLTIAKWEKIAQLILQIFMYYGSEVLPPTDANAMVDVGSSGSLWWKKTMPRNATEQRDELAQRFSCAECEQKLLECCDPQLVSGSEALLHLSLFDEEKLYCSRMILCNAVAFCSTRMIKYVDEHSGLTAGRAPLLSVAHRQQNGSRPAFPSMGSMDRRAFAAATDPLWTQAPSISEFTVRFDMAVASLEASQQLLEGLGKLKNVVPQVGLGPSARRREHLCDTSQLQNLIEYHMDSMTFVVENMLVVLLLHFVHYLSLPETAEGSIQQTVVKVLNIIGEIESNPFVHAIARRLREFATNGRS